MITNWLTEEVETVQKECGDLLPLQSVLKQLIRELGSSSLLPRIEIQDEDVIEIKAESCDSTERCGAMDTEMAENYKKSKLQKDQLVDTGCAAKGPKYE